MTANRPNVCKICPWPVDFKIHRPDWMVKILVCLLMKASLIMKMMMIFIVVGVIEMYYLLISFKFQLNERYLLLQVP